MGSYFVIFFWSPSLGSYLTVFWVIFDVTSFGHFWGKLFLGHFWDVFGVIFEIFWVIYCGKIFGVFWVNFMEFCSFLGVLLCGIFCGHFWG